MGKKGNNYVRGNGNLPALSVKGNSIPEAWENSVVKLYEKGLWYKRSGRKDKGCLQVDSTMTIEITNPNSDLYMHKYMTCGIKDLFGYQMEILGAKDSWVDTTGKTTRWPYHYHERLISYPGSKNLINQIDLMIEKLSNSLSTRKSNGITWVPERDFDSQDPPCLQRIWLGLIPDEISEDNTFILNMNYNFRSRNVMIAAPMNQTGLATLQIYLRNKIIEKTGKNIKLGRIVDFTDGYHVSARDQPILEGFVNRLKISKEKGEGIEERCFSKEFAFKSIEQMKSEIEEQMIEQTKKYLSGKKLEVELENILKVSQEVRDININSMSQ